MSECTQLSKYSAEIDNQIDSNDHLD